MLRRQWNTIAALAVVVILTVVLVAAFLAVTGKIDFKTFIAATAPIVTAIMGWMARGAGVSDGQSQDQSAG